MDWNISYGPAKSKVAQEYWWKKKNKTKGEKDGCSDMGEIHVSTALKDIYSTEVLSQLCPGGKIFILLIAKELFNHF